MRKHNPYQSLSDILTSIEAAYEYLGSRSFEEFSSDAMRVDAVRVRIQDASEAARRLRKDAPDLMREIEMRNPDIFWQELRDFSSVSRHDYDLIEADRIWEDLQQNGKFTHIAEAVRRELPLSR